MEKNKPPHQSVGYTTVEQILNSPDPDIAGSYYAMQRAGQAAIDLAIQTNTAIVTTVDGKIVRIPAAELIKQRQLKA
ncbi:hypothetical protein [Polynucleobacter sp. AP-Nino-20-G2]|uniref:hypothetical protein n=1 Tax=Polynucleobacter sp. AP-Nino-20-G2 TaxID=2576917 RepID=UPI001BFCF682|nr:hypothetical protein [Polynucleobacter sp. AP-Nino-20-G2]QWE17040.1 hypothetical protein FD960_02090 [Polynucleobacter sp. AP-Nino-20-G2]